MRCALTRRKSLDLWVEEDAGPAPALESRELLGGDFLVGPSDLRPEQRVPNSQIPNLTKSPIARKEFDAHDLAALGQMLSEPLNTCTSFLHCPTRGAATPRPVSDPPFFGGAGRALTF